MRRLLIAVLAATAGLVSVAQAQPYHRVPPRVERRIIRHQEVRRAIRHDELRR